MTAHPSGVAAEELAARYLAAQGLRVVARNYRCRFGEIDLIAWDGAALVFVEVRLRRGSRFGGALASITPAKQRKLVATARCYLAGLRNEPACRFDAILLDALDAERIEWLRDIIGG
ncbi:MAG: YraN family protein [Betaproteobacteria bacterium]|nr:YraN family protein [Betaproteobacteria bacterium]